MGEKRKLVTTVWVDGEAYGPDSDVPADVAERITNPRAWGEEADDEGSREFDSIKLAKPAPTPADVKLAQVAQAEADAAEGESETPAKKPAAKKSTAKK